MTPTRRQFIRQLGVTLASLVVAGYVPACTSKRSAWNELRNCWLRLDWLARRTRGDYALAGPIGKFVREVDLLAHQAESDSERGQQILESLVADHQAALDDLVAAGELDAAVADHIHVAYVEAANHVWLSNAPITCYIAAWPDYTPGSASELVWQADLLAEMAESGDIDPDTVAQAQAAIERDIALLNLSPAEAQAMYEELWEASGDVYNPFFFDELDLEVTPEAAEAACILVDLLIGELE
jgi:hypothetical protein